MDKYSPLSTLFLHEDVLARTFSYEEDLHKWRLAELGAGRPDPGRPSYIEVSGDLYSPSCLISALLGIWWLSGNETSLPLLRNVR